MPGVGREALRYGVECVLPLVGVDEDAEEDVDDVDECVSEEDAFPEIPLGCVSCVLSKVSRPRSFDVCFWSMYWSRLPRDSEI